MSSKIYETAWITLKSKRSISCYQYVLHLVSGKVRYVMGRFKLSTRFAVSRVLFLNQELSLHHKHTQQLCSYSIHLSLNNEHGSTMHASTRYQRRHMYAARRPSRKTFMEENLRRSALSSYQWNKQELLFIYRIIGTVPLVSQEYTQSAFGSLFATIDLGLIATTSHLGAGNANTVHSKCCTESFLTW